MKKFMIISILAAFFAAGTSVLAQDNQEDWLGLPGDNLNLYAVMKLFQESKTLESFENGLNDKNSNINNLDLNGDNFVDYIRVIDNVDGDVHNIVLQVAVNQRENQDIAVFTVQRFQNGQVQIQLIGDEELYGRNYIIEPIFDDNGQTPNPGYTGNSKTIYGRNVNVVRTTTYEIAAWPVIRFIYRPDYVVWHSSWYWGYYPSYWNPWEPYYWHYYYGYHYNWYNDYYGHYRRWDNHRYTRWNDFYYTSRRSHSTYVDSRIQAGNYKNTYSRPEQRRDGEALFTRQHPDQSRRVQDNPSVNTQGRRSVSESTQKRQPVSTGTNTTRRSNSTVTNRSETNRPSGQNTGSDRRSTTVTNKSVSNRTSGQNTGSDRRSTTVTNKPVSNSSSGQNTGNSRRSTTVTNKNESNQSSEKTAAPGRTTGQSKPTGVSTSNRRSTTTKKSETTVKQGEKPKETVIKKDTRRK
jgi:hypothetical protein